VADFNGLSTKEIAIKTYEKVNEISGDIRVHNTRLDSHAKAIGWLFGIFGSAITTVVVLALRGSL
jgi:hypothetical protein